MASFGEIAVGERRMSWARPGRSAILGLVAAAKGIERSDEVAHRRLESGLHYAVRTEASGIPLTDYHTAQTPRARKGRNFATRREELESEDLNTVLSTREWRVDASFTVALWPRHGAALDIEEIAGALRRPFFVIYMGRKSAPTRPAPQSGDRRSPDLSAGPGCPSAERRGAPDPAANSAFGRAPRRDCSRRRRAGSAGGIPRHLAPGTASRRAPEPHPLAVHGPAGAHRHAGDR